MLGCLKSTQEYYDRYACQYTVLVSMYRVSIYMYGLVMEVFSYTSTLSYQVKSFKIEPRLVKEGL